MYSGRDQAQQGPRISAARGSSNPARPRLSPLHNKHNPTLGSRASEAAAPEPGVELPLPQGRRLLFPPPPSSHMFLSSCSAPFAQGLVTLAAAAARASSTFLCQNHKARTQFLWVYQEIRCGRARRTHTLCNMTNTVNIVLPQPRAAAGLGLMELQPQKP